MEPNQPNSGPPAPDPIFTGLMHRHLLGDLTPDEFEHLEQAMLSSPDLRATYLQAVRIDAELLRHADSAHEVRHIPPAAKSRWLPLAIAAAVALLIPVLWHQSKPRAAAPGPVTEVATVGDVRKCIWANNSNVRLNNRLPAGLLELKSGVAVIEFDSGARLALQGPATLELINSKTARLRHGSASVRCEEGVYSFSLLTPTSVVMDLGTEFGVAVDESGASEVHVIDGEVEVTSSLKDERQYNRFLTEGNTLLLSSNGNNEILPQSTRTWIRDYTTQADRQSKTIPPRVIAHDGFPSDMTQQNRFSLGSGWRGSWWQSTPPRKGAIFGFTSKNPIAARDGNKHTAMVLWGWMEARRFLADPIDPTRKQTVYLGFSLIRTNNTRMDKGGKLGEASVLFRSSKDPSSLLGIALSGRNHLVVTEPGGWERSEIPVNGKRPLFIVAKVEFNPLRGNRVSMVSYDQDSPFPSQEPDQWDLVTSRQLAELTAPLDTIAIQVRLTPFKFGEITLGNSWQAVTHPAAPAE